MVRKVYVVGNTREEFKNFANSDRPYNDHPSRASIDYILQHLTKLGYDAYYYGGINELIHAYDVGEKFADDVLFINASDGMEHASRKGMSAMLLELLGVKYVGSGACSRLLAGNKHFAKSIVASAGIKTPKGILLQSEIDINSIDLKFPLIVKPNREGSSIGITQNSYIDSRKDLLKQVGVISREYSEIIIEEYIKGYEVTNFIIGTNTDIKLSEVILSQYNGKLFFDRFIFGTEEKSNRQRVQILAETVLDNNTIMEIKRASETIFRVLEMNDFARVDYRVNSNGIYFIEINGNPVISATSEIGLLTREKNIDFGHIIELMIESALARHLK